MKITFILGSMGRGGAERVISILSREYAQKGWETEIIMLLSDNVEYDLHETTKVLDFSAGGGSRIKRLPYWLRSVRKHIRDGKPDVVLSFAARINIIVQAVCLGLNQKIIVSERNDPKCDGRSVFVRCLTKLLYPLAHCVVFQTKRAASYFKGLKNTVIIPNPIEVAVYANKEKQTKIVNVGRLTLQKNQKMLIKAFFEIHKKYPEYSLEIYGEGELRAELQALIKQLELDEKVFLMGNQKNIHERICDAQIFVLSSDYEGLSNALLEAMVMGLPCISTTCAGSDEVICDGENGILIQVGDGRALEEAMEALIKDKTLCQKISENSRKSSETVKKENVTKQWMKIIEGECLCQLRS